MKLRIVHHTHYKYSEGVVLEPHILRFHPRTDLTLNVLSFEMAIEPKPSGQSHKLGISSNQEQVIWFDGLVDHLDLRATSVVETTNTNPLNFLLYPFTATRLPMVYDSVWHNQLLPFIQPVSENLEFRRFAKEMMLEADFLTVPFLTLLTETIHKQYQYEHREAGNPYLPEYTMLLRRGSCRDLAFLQMALCREAGLAARFVSGYHFEPDPDRRNELHAWVEVYLPGAGWRGFDPTMGLMAAENHVPVAAAAQTEACTPVTGAYRGKASSTLSSTVTIDRG